MALAFAIVTNRVGGGIGGLPFGIIIGLAYYYADRRDRRHDRPIPEDYPEDLQRVERHHSKQTLILFPTLIFVGTTVSWIITGTGAYGFVIGSLLGAFIIPWFLARFGGPSDPRWRRIRDEWERRHPELID